MIRPVGRGRLLHSALTGTCWVLYLSAGIGLVQPFALSAELKGSAAQAPGGKVANKDEHAYIDVLLLMLHLCRCYTFADAIPLLALHIC